MKNKILLLTAALGLAAANSRADYVYDFTNQGGIFDSNTSLTVTLSGSLNMTVTGSGTLNDNATGIGISDDQIDGTAEFIELTFNRDIQFISIEFGAVGSDASDGVSLTLGTPPSISLYTGVTGFQATPDIYTPVSPILISQGEKITITGTSETSSFDLENITVIPEPSSIILVGIAGFALCIHLRKRKNS